MLQNIEDIIYYKFESFTKKLQFNKKRFRDFNFMRIEERLIIMNSFMCKQTQTFIKKDEKKKT